MNRLLKCHKLYLTVILIFCFSCSTPHKISTELLNSVKNNTFEIGRVTIPCYEMKQVPRQPWERFYVKYNQFEMLEAIPTNEILNILADSYGINTNMESKLSIDYSVENIVGWLLTDTAGRCYRLENKSDVSNDNIIDIEYTLGTRRIPLMPFKIWLRYIVTVRSGGSILIRHEGDVASYEYPLFSEILYKDLVNNIKVNASNIPIALKRDIKSHNNEIK